MTGQRHFNETLFDNVILSEDALLGVEGKGWSQVVGELALERSGPERFLSHFTLLESFINEFKDILIKSGSKLIGKLIAELQTLRRMSFSIASMLQNGESPETQALRESTEGLFYTAAVHNRCPVDNNDEVQDIMRITRKTTEKLHDFAFRLARQRKSKGKLGKVTCVDKANVFRSQDHPRIFLK